MEFNKENEALKNRARQLSEEELTGVSGGAGTGSDKKAVIINCDAVNIRNATSGGDVIGKIRAGETVTYHKKEGLWAYITYKRITGYVYGDYIQVL